MIAGTYNSRVDDITLSDLQIMSQAVNYRRWIYSRIEPMIGRSILEVGGGIGNFTELFPMSAHITTIEPHPDCVRVLRERFGSVWNVEVVETDLLSYQPKRLFDTIVCLNVLEHILDDGAAVKKIASLLTPDGHLLALLPACRALYGDVDRALLHYRRYGRRQARALMETSGLRVRRLEYMNLVGFFGWFFNARVLKRTTQSRAQVAVYDNVVVPVMRVVEAVVRPPIGQSLFVVASGGS